MRESWLFRLNFSTGNTLRQNRSCGGGETGVKEHPAFWIAWLRMLAGNYHKAPGHIYHTHDVAIPGYLLPFNGVLAVRLFRVIDLKPG
jgi:hypothetical protein